MLELEVGAASQIEFETQFVTKYRSELVAFMRTLTKNNALAEDISHDAFLTVIKRLRTTGIDNPSSLRPYLKKTAYYLYLGSLRKLSNHLVTAENPDLYQHDQLLLEDKLEQARMVETIQLLLQELPIERDKQILKRYYLDEEPKSSICEFLDLSLAHFDRVLFRARRRLKGIATDLEITTAIL